jgi:hypothetical protein
VLWQMTYRITTAGCADRLRVNMQRAGYVEDVGVEAAQVRED